MITAAWYGGFFFGTLVALMLALAVFEWATLCRRQSAIAAGLRRSTLLVAGVVYIVFACLSLAWLRANHTDGAMLVLMILLAVWASDTGAYLAGSLIGGPKLAPRISPKKTWAGVAGGLACATLVGAAMARYGGASDSRAMAVVMALAIFIGLMAVFGDLLESFVKRAFVVKDSGSMIPGHGGVLDRIDGLLAAACGAAILSAVLPENVEFWP